MKFEYRVNLKDLKEATKTDLEMIIFRSGVGFILCVTTSTLSKISKGIFDFKIFLLESIQFAAAFSIFIAILYCIHEIVRNYNLNETYKKSSVYREETNVEVNKEGFMITNTVAETKLKWSICKNWRETSNLFVIYYQTNNLFNIFQKRAFANKNQLHEFREILRANVQQNKNSFLERYVGM